MSPLLKWLRRVTLFVLLATATLVGGVYGRSSFIRRHTWDAVPPTYRGVPPTDAASVAEGGRLARILGCYGGCHGTQVEGALFFSQPRVADLVAPNLTRLVPGYPDGELARAIRHGIRRDGTGLFAMPSASFYHLSDEDLGRVMAFLRRQPREEGYGGDTSIGPMGHIGIAMGRFRPAPEAMDHGVTRLDPGVGGDAVTRGRYLATVACTECHGLAFEGGLEGQAPPLAIAGIYTDAAFRHLLRTGESLGRRDLYLMDDVARSRFVHFTDDEITAMHTFLRTQVR